MKKATLPYYLIIASVLSIHAAHSKEALNEVNLLCMKKNLPVLIEFQGDTIIKSFTSINNINNKTYNFKMEVVEINNDHYGYTATEGVIFACNITSFKEGTCPVESPSSLAGALIGRGLSAGQWFMIDRYNLDYSEGAVLGGYDKVFTTDSGKCVVASEEDVQSLKNAMDEDRRNSMERYDEKILEMKSKKKEF
jgi:hypothetical protein